MNDFDPGDGWRLLESGEHHDLGAGTTVLHEYVIGDGTTDRSWVHEDPMPPLPTEPYTVIRVTFKSGPALEYVLFDDGWAIPGSGIAFVASEDLGRNITGFEVLASPERWLRDRAIREETRRETAKAVLDEIRATYPWTDAQWELRVHRIAQRFEVEP